MAQLVGFPAGRALDGKSRSQIVSDQNSVSDLLEIVKRNGDFRKNYGTIIGAYLYLRSLNAAVGRSLREERYLIVACTVITDVPEAVGP
jgi:hypothetical protein